MEIFERYPDLAKQLEILCQTRRNEILSIMLQTDSVYKKLCQDRADISMTLKNTLIDSKADTLFEKYSDVVYAQEIYELDSIYRQAIYDILKVLDNNDLL